MKRFDVILLFIVFLLSSTVLFQNCSEMKGVESDLEVSEDISSELNEPDLSQPVPEFLENRSLAFDNKVVTNGEPITFYWSLGSEDLFYYETDYQATYKSTLVTITGRNSVPYFKVESDTCNKEEALTGEEAQDFSDLYSAYIQFTEIRMRNGNEEQTLGCSFPRLALNAKLVQNDTEPVDFDIYFATESCAPSAEFYVTDRNSNDPTVAKEEVESFFNSKIDQVCGF